jgi:hypothetical protein
MDDDLFTQGGLLERRKTQPNLHYPAIPSEFSSELL